MSWEAWLLMARSRAEDAVKARESSIKKRLRRCVEELEAARERLKKALEEARSLVRRAGELSQLKHHLSQRLRQEERKLGEKINDVLARCSELLQKDARLSEEAKHVEDLLEEAERCLKLGQVDRALDVSLQASRTLASFEVEARTLARRLEGFAGELEAEAKVLRSLTKRVDDDMKLASRVAVELAEGEEIRVSRACRLGELGKGILIITNKRLLFTGPSGRGMLEVPRSSVVLKASSRGLLGLGRKLILDLGGREVKVSGDKEGLRSIEEELRGST